MTVTALIVAALAARDAAVLGTATRYPELAVRLAPANATAITRMFDKVVLSPEGVRGDLRGWVAAARQALRADPLNASGIRLLAYVTQLTSGGLPKARELMRLSERASRRDVLAQVWLIEDAVQRGDVGGALQHYDRALSVRPAIAGQLIPVMVAASSEPAIRASLTPYLRANRPWVPTFLSVLVDKSTDPVAAAALFRQYGGARAVPDHAVYETGLVKRLVATGMVREARAYAVSAGAGGAVDQFGFTSASVAPRFRPLAWSLYEGFEGTVSTTPSSGMTIAVRPEAKIVAATRIVLPPSRRLILRQRVSYPDDGAMPLVTWKAYCRRLAGPPQQFWALDLPQSSQPTMVEAAIDVPEACAGMQIDIEATGARGAADSKASLDRVDLATR